MNNERLSVPVTVMADAVASERVLTSLHAQKHAMEMMLEKAPLADILAHLACSVEEQSGGNAIASILLLDDENALRRGAAPSLPDHYQQAIDGIRIAPDLGTCAAAAATGQIVITTDFSTDPGWTAIRHLPLALGLLAAWSMPIKARDGRVLGTFGTYFRETRGPTPEEMHSVRILVQTAALAIERDRSESSLRLIAGRQAFLLELADLLRPLSRPDDIVAAATALLGQHLDVSRVMYAEVNEAGDTFFTRHDWVNHGVASIAGEIRRLDDFGPEIIAGIRTGEPMVVPDISLDPRAAPYAHAYEKIGVQAHMAIPLVKSGQVTIILALHHALPRKWSQYDIEVAREMAERTWSAAESARAQGELRKERDRSRHIFDTMTEGLALLGSDDTLLYINEAAARIARQPAKALAGQDHWQAFPELLGTEVEKLYRRVQSTGQPESIEHFHAFPSGQTAWIAIRAYASLDGGLAVFFSDITARKRAEQELLEASRRKDEFLAMLAHELRNPLAPISSAADLLGFIKHDESRVMQARDVIARQVRHMTSLVDDLLDVSRVTRGVVTLDKKHLDLRQLVYEAVEQVNPLIESRRHNLALHLTPESTTVMGDSNRLVQVIANLLNNAAKYTPEGGTIVLETATSEGFVILTVTDNGIGMEPDLIRNVFGLFTQASRSSDRSSGGLGIGLALVKSLAELHGGSVACESGGPGKGSRFTLRLPRLAAQAADMPTQDQHAGQPDLRPLRILVVDDNIDAANMLALLLGTSGHEVLVEHASAPALTRAQQDLPDVCLLDIGLPDIDGYELAHRLRNQSETENAVLIAVTGYGQDNDRKQAQISGFDHYLTKPVDMKKLSDLLAAASRS